MKGVAQAVVPFTGTLSERGAVAAFTHKSFDGGTMVFMSKEKGVPGSVFLTAMR